MKTKALRALLGAFILSALTFAVQAAPGNSKMSDRALEALENNPNEWVDLIITYAQPPTDEDRDEMERGGGSAELGYLQPGEEREVEFRFRTYEVDSFSGSWELLSTRGGVVRGAFEGG